MRLFFFASESPRPAALMRIAVGVVLLYDAAVRWPYAIELYSSAGLPMPLFPRIGSAGFVDFEPTALGAAWTVVLDSLLVFSLCAVVAGWKTRTSLLLAAGLGVWLGLLDHAGTFKKYSVIGLHLLVLLSLTSCGGAWSVDALLRRRRIPRGAARGLRGLYGLSQPLSPVWPRRLMQFLICSIYLGAAVTKIRLPDFANGDLLMFSLMDDQWGGTYAGLWLSTRPRLLIAAGMGTVLLEVAFPLLVWVRRMRRPMLLLAAAFHAGLWMTMHLGIFSAMMLAALLAFVREEDLAWAARVTDRWRASTGRLRRGRLPDTAMAGGALNRKRTAASWVGAGVTGSAAYVIAAGAWAAGGLGLQYATDTYGVFRGRETDTFATFDPETMVDVLAAQTPAEAGHYGDYFHRIEVGSRLSKEGTHAFGARETFSPGMTVFAVARLIQRHPTMTLEWVLVRPDGGEAVHSYTLHGSVSHTNVGFSLADPRQTPPGRYRLVLRAEGHQVAERRFTLPAPRD